MNHQHYMKMALNEAKAALNKGEIPVGAIIVAKDQIIAKGHNLTEQLNDFTAHAEMIAFTSASDFLSGKFLNKCSLYVTLEPCVMCAGAAFNTRIGKIIYGASDVKRGYTQYHHHDNYSTLIHPKTEVISGVMEEECSALLIDFFQSKRD